MITHQGVAGSYSIFAATDELLLVSVVRAMYPHPGVPDGPYERVVGLLLDEATHAPPLALAVRSVLMSVSTSKASPGELELTAALEVIAATDSFEAVRSRVCHHLYADREVWVLMGYPGASFADGGYIHRGFDDLSWLPEPRIVESGEAMVDVVASSDSVETERRA
ncbi:MAG: hypothetical protein Q7J04_07650 [Microcella sp.]|nr:hypothetical protein [Microcella sp.]